MPTAPTRLGQALNKDVTLAVMIAAFAWGAGWLIERAGLLSPGASAIAMFAGIAATVVSGLDFPRSRILVAKGLPVAIVLLGFDLDLSTLDAATVGIAGAIAIAATVVTSFGVALIAGRAAGLDTRSSLALGVGGAICGNSAVLAVAPSLRLRNDDTALILAAINLLGLGMFFVVVAGSGAVGLDPIAAGIWAGASIHAVPQAIAAGEALGPAGLAVATAVKLSRVAMLVVVVPAIGFVGQRMLRTAEDGGQTRRASIPWFVPGFVIAAVLGNLLPDAAGESAGYAGRLVLLPVLAAVGLAVTRSSLRRSGGRVFAAGLAATVGIAVVSLLVVATLRP